MAVGVVRLLCSIVGAIYIRCRRPACYKLRGDVRFSSRLASVISSIAPRPNTGWRQGISAKMNAKAWDRPS